MKAIEVINKAKAFNGYLEKETLKNITDFKANSGDENITWFNKIYGELTNSNAQGLFWCAIFVSVIFYLAGKKSLTAAKEALCGNVFASCATGAERFRKARRLHKNPEPGDVIFFTDGKRICHTGIVTKVDSERVYTMEGNTSSDPGIVRNGGSVNDKSYLLNNNRIYGYGRPIYDA